jgi:hypothetical protein
VLQMLPREGELALCHQRQARSIMLVALPLLRRRDVGHHKIERCLATRTAFVQFATQRVDARPQGDGESGDPDPLPRVALHELAPGRLEAQHLVPLVQAQAALTLKRQSVELLSDGMNARREVFGFTQMR